jgi:hypothetical protein
LCFARGSEDIARGSEDIARGSEDISMITYSPYEIKYTEPLFRLNN